MGAPLVSRVSPGDDNEDRKRLKEKLKATLCWERGVYTGCERRLKAGDRLEDGDGARVGCGARRRCSE